MKKLLFYFLCIAAVLVLTVPVYFRPSVRAEITVSAPSLIKTRISYVPAETDDPVYLTTFSVKGRQKLRFTMHTPELSAVNLEFNVHTDMKVKIGTLFLHGQNDNTFFPAAGQTEITFPVEKDETFSFDNLSVSAVRRFDPVLFIFIFISASLLLFTLQKSKTMRILSAAIAGYTAFSLSCNINPAQSNMLFGTLIFSFLFFFYNRFYKKEMPVNLPLALSGIIFGTVNLLSLCLYRFDSWDFIAQNSLLCLIGVIGQGILFYTIGLCFFKFMSGRSFFKPYTGRQYMPRLVGFYRRHTVLCAFLIILICWLPWHFLYYPGIFPWDSKGQIKQTMDLLPKSQRHPVLSTFLISACFQAGSRIKDYNLGIYFYTALQSCVCAFIFALCLNRIKQLGLNFYFQLACLIFFSVYPVGGFIAIWDMKDTLYAGITTLFILQTLSGLYAPERYFVKNRQLCAYAVVFLLVCLLRRNGIFVALPTIAAMLLFSDIPGKTKKITAFLTGTAVCCFFLLNQVVFLSLGYAQGPKKEALSIPFQQTARYLKTRPSDITAEEYRTISRVLDISDIIRDYAPLTAAYTKKTYKIEGDPEENKKLAAYLKTAAKLFFRHPLTGLQATMANSFGYYAFTPYFVIEQSEPFDPLFCTAAPNRFENARTAINTFYNDEMASSLLYAGVRAPVYTWLLALLGLYVYTSGQRKKLLYLTASVMSVLICIASPLNGMLRLFLPVITAMPVVFAFCAAPQTDAEKQAEEHQ